jgi:hypothetical protein
MTGGLRVDALTRRLAECPLEFLAEPRLTGAGPGGIHVAAVVSDLLADLGAPGPLGEAQAARWERARPADRNLHRLTLVACWLAHDDAFREARCHAPVETWLAQGLSPLARLVAADVFVTDPDRREELARSLLAALGLVPAGETPAQASDRLKELSSVERAQVISDTRAQQARARTLREKMEAERARQAAARYSSE